MDGIIWGFVIIGGPILIAAAVIMVYFQRRSRLTGSPEAKQATRENWGKEKVR